MKNQLFLSITLLIIAATAFGQPLKETVTDIDGNVYHTVKIGTQTWLTENLRTTKYRNGNLIPNITDGTEWGNLTTGAYSDHSNTPTNSSIYGKLYNFYTVANPGNLCPKGWHVPTDAEWTTLTTYLGGENVAGGKMKEVGTAHWQSPNTDATNESGFTALPCGLRNKNGSFYSSIGSYGGWWSSTEYAYDTKVAILRYMGNYDGGVYSKKDFKTFGLSVRCLKD